MGVVFLKINNSFKNWGDKKNWGDFKFTILAFKLYLNLFYFFKLTIYIKT